MKKLTLAVLALGLGITALAVQVRHENTRTARIVLSDGPPPDCTPDCGNLK